MQALRVVEVGGERAALALNLPSNVTFEQWEAEGRWLSQMNHALQWYIGDWWNAGEKFGDETRAETAKRLFGLEYQRIRNIGSVAGKFQVSCRRDNLSFTHHEEVASLPSPEAGALLARTEREHWSVKDLRRAVQALKAANDPEPSEEPEIKSKPMTTQSLQAQLTTAYETVVEFAEALEQLRPLTRRETDLLTIAETFLGEAHAEHRPCPVDFDIIFVEQGRLACETWYNASRLTINRWLIERGKSRLITKRSEFVRFQREQQHLVQAPSAQREAVAVSRLAQEAAHFLRISRYGGWTITATGDGDWLVGTVRKTSDELIAMAERQGFDSLALQADEATEVKS